jgi:hypothetical protein
LTYIVQPLELVLSDTVKALAQRLKGHIPDGVVHTVNEYRTNRDFDYAPQCEARR